MVVVANQMISNSLLYIIQLWPGRMQALDDLDKQIQNFVWSGQEDFKQPRVNYRETLLLPKDKGGRGLISVKHQFCTMVGGLILWSIGEGDQMLQHIIKKKLGDLSEVQGELGISLGLCPGMPPSLFKVKLRCGRDYVPPGIWIRSILSPKNRRTGMRRNFCPFGPHM